MSALLEARGLSVSLGGREVLSGVDVDVRAGEVVGLVGPNGAGKTTLLRMLTGLLAPVRGEVRFDGTRVNEIPRQALARALAYLPQRGEGYWAMPVRSLVMVGRLPHLGPWRGPGKADAAAVDAALEATETTHLAERPITQLSGGERARVLLARALAGEPRLLLADEPVSGLDPYHRLEVMEHLRALRTRTAVVVVLHDLTLAGRFCDRLILLHDGRVAASGPPADVLNAERLAQVYRIEAIRGRENGDPFVVPWRRLPGHGEHVQ